MHSLHFPARYPDEYYSDYQSRRGLSKTVINLHLKGKVIWDSTNKGTFRYKKASK